MIVQHQEHLHNHTTSVVMEYHHHFSNGASHTRFKYRFIKTVGPTVKKGLEAGSVFGRPGTEKGRHKGSEKSAEKWEKR